MPHSSVGPTRRSLFALATALTLIAAACGGDDSGDGAASPTTAVSDDEAVAGPEETTTTAAPSAVESVEEEGGPATVLELGGPVEAGRYVTDLLGPELEMDLDERWLPVVGDPGGFVIESTEKLSDFGDAVIFARMSSFAGPSDFDDPNPPGPHLSGSPTDFDAWLAASGELLVDSDDTVTVDGVEARQVQVRIDPDGTATIPGGCGPTPDDRCFFVGGTLSDTLFFFIVRTSEVYRMWYVPQAGFDEPLLIMATATEGNEQFLDQASELVESISLGEPAAHPVELPDGPLWESGLAATVPAGPVTIPALGGLAFEMTEERFVFQEGNFVAFESSVETGSPFPPGAMVALVARFADGEEVDGVVGFLEALESYGTVDLSGDRLSALGEDLVGYDFVDGSDPEIRPLIGFSSAPADGSSNFAWAPNPFARLYLADTPDGVLVIGYDGFTAAEQQLGRNVFADIVPTLTSTAEKPIPIPGAS